MRRALKRLAARLPPRWQQELKRRYFGRQVRSRAFHAGEPEFELLPSMVSPGDWVLDIGANIGHYTIRLSELVGARGRVISFEPVPATFELLASNAALSPQCNISLLNAAASESPGTSGMEIPQSSDSGLDNFYTAHLSDAASELTVLCIAVDSLALPNHIRLVKIDAEGHELPVLRGMKELLVRDHPTLIVEDNDPEVSEYLVGFGYSSSKLPGSSNRLFEAGRAGESAPDRASEDG